MKNAKFTLSATCLAVLAAVSSTTVFADTENSITLDEITVTDRQGTKVQTNVVTSEEKDEHTETDLRGLLKKEPAIDFGGGNGTSQFLSVRGMGQNSVDVKVDNAYSDSQILYHQARFIIDPSLLKSISVQKGAGSASAGIGATNGAIITKTADALDLLKGKDRNFGFKLNSGYSSNDGRSYGATLFGKAGNFDALLSVNRNDERNYKAGKGYNNGLDDSDYVPYSALDKRTYLAKLGATFGDHRIVLSHLQDQHRGTRLVREEFAAFSSSVNARLSMTRQSPSYRETTLNNTNLEYIGKNIGFADEITANVYIMKNKRYSADDSGCGYCGNVAGPTTTEIETRGANINIDSNIDDNVLVKYGVNYRRQEIEPHIMRSTVSNHPKKTDRGIYAEVIGGVGDFTLTGGLRYDYFNITTNTGTSAGDGKFNPSVGLIYQATPELSFSANHNYASRSPRLYDALMVGIRAVPISSSIKAEQARNTEIGFNYNNGNFSLEGSYFWQKVKDVIVNDQNRHGTSVRETINAGYSKNYGYELAASYHYQGFTGRIGVSDSKPRFYLDGVTSLNPEFAVQAGRTWTMGLAYRFTTVNLELGWNNRTVEDENGGVVVGQAGTRREGYTVHDFYANWKPFNNDSLNINFAINNAFNKLYYPHTQRGQTLAGVGRDYRIGFNYTF